MKVSYTPLLQTYKQMFLQIEASGHPKPVGVLLDPASFKQLVAEGNSLAMIQLPSGNSIGQVELLGVVFRSAR